MNDTRYHRPAVRRDIVDRLRATKRIIEHCVSTWTATSVSLNPPVEIDGQRRWWRRATPAELPENRAAAWIDLSSRLSKASRQLADLAIEAEHYGKGIIRIELEAAQHGNQPTH